MIATSLLHRLGLAALAMLLVAGATGLPRVQQDPDILSLLAADHPERQRYDRWREHFGQTDALVAVISTGAGKSVLEAANLDFVRRVGDVLAAVPGLDVGGIGSLHRQRRPVFDDGELRVEPLTPTADADADPGPATERSLRAAPVFDGLLVSQDRSATLVVAPLAPGARGDAVYPAARAALERLAIPAGLNLQLAGDAAVTGFLSAYIERDALVLTPVAVLMSLLILAAWLRHPAALLPGGGVILGTLLITLGLMGWAACPVYVITSSLPAILACVSVADCVHLAHGVRRHQAAMATPEAVDAGLRDQLRPMALTSLTTIAGFIGIAAGSGNAPMREFGLFAALGTAVAFALTVLVVPRVMRRFPATIGRPHVDRGEPTLRAPLQAALAAKPRRAAAAALLLTGGAALGLGQLQFNEERIRNFAPDSEIRRADTRLNQGFAGSRTLDLGLVAERPGDLMQPAVIERVRGLQQALDEAGLMRGAHSYVDLIDLMRTAAAEGTAVEPLASSDEAEQWLFLYELQGERRAIDDRLSAARDRAYIRGYRASDNYQALRPAVAQIRALAGSGVRAELTGPAFLILPLFEPVVPSMLLGAALALGMVALSAALVLRSAAQGLLCALPVSLSLLAVFGVMGWAGIWLDVATAMMASIAIGLGVDFAIYVQHAALQGRGAGIRGADLSAHIYQRVAAPLGANAMILALGFSVTALSSIPPVRNFGLLVAASVLAAAASSLLLLPALHALASRRHPVPRTAPQVPA